MANFTPNGIAAEFFGVLGPYLPPPPPEAPSPLLWETRRTYASCSGTGCPRWRRAGGASRDGAGDARRLLRLPGQTFGPVIAASRGARRTTRSKRGARAGVPRLRPRGRTPGRRRAHGAPLRVSPSPGAQIGLRAHPDAGACARRSFQLLLGIASRRGAIAWATCRRKTRLWHWGRLLFVPSGDEIATTSLAVAVHETDAVRAFERAPRPGSR